MCQWNILACSHQHCQIATALLVKIITAPGYVGWLVYGMSTTVGLFNAKDDFLSSSKNYMVTTNDNSFKKIIALSNYS